MEQANQMPEIGEVFAAQGAEDLIYMGDHLIVRNADKKTERRIDLTEQMIAAIPTQYARYRAWISRPGTHMGV